MTPDTRAMQDDDKSPIPACCGCSKAKHCGMPTAGAAGQGLCRLPPRCAQQHEGRRNPLSSLRQDTRSSGRSRAAHQPLPRPAPAGHAACLRKPRVAGAVRVRRAAVARRDHRDRRRSAARAVRREGPRAVPATAGPAQSRLRQLPRRQLGQAPCRDRHHAGAPDRLPVVPAGMAKRSVPAAPPARLHPRASAPSLTPTARRNWSNWNSI